jgi:hypothetical protein
MFIYKVSNRRLRICQGSLISVLVLTAAALVIGMAFLSFFTSRATIIRTDISIEESVAYEASNVIIRPVGVLPYDSLNSLAVFSVLRLDGETTTLPFAFRLHNETDEVWVSPVQGIDVYVVDDTDGDGIIEQDTDLTAIYGAGISTERLMRKGTQGWGDYRDAFEVTEQTIYIYTVTYPYPGSTSPILLIGVLVPNTYIENGYILDMFYYMHSGSGYYYEVNTIVLPLRGLS